MALGVSFPQTEIGSDPVAIRDFAQAVEEMGYDYLTCIDHVLQERTVTGPEWTAAYTRDKMYHEPMVLFGYLAALTKRIDLVTAILILPQRPTALVAKQAAEIDVLSNGRLRLGVGLGWSKMEFDALGQNFHDRGKRSEEQVEVMRRLWTEEIVNFEGRWHRITEAGINPLPVQRPIPVWFGAFVNPAIERLARIGDGWLLNPRMPPGDEARRQLELMRRTAEAAGRDPAEIGIDATVLAKPNRSNEWVDLAHRWRNLGATHITFRTMAQGYGSIDDQIEAARFFKEAVGQ